MVIFSPNHGSGRRVVLPSPDWTPDSSHKLGESCPFDFVPYAALGKGYAFYPVGTGFNRAFGVGCMTPEEIVKNASDRDTYEADASERVKHILDVR